MRPVKLALILALLLAGCGRATPVTLSATPTTAVTTAPKVASTATITPTMEPSPTQTAAPSPTSTLAPSSTALEHLLSPIAELPGFMGEWSPTANQLAGIRWVDKETGYLNIVSAPDFEQNIVSQDRFFFGESTLGHHVSWSPDGDTVMFDGPTEFGPIRDLTTPWAVSYDGQVAKPIHKDREPERSVQIPGWLDEQTMILSGYMGGDTHYVQLVEFQDGTVLADAKIHGTVYPGRPVGAPFVLNASGPVIGIFTLQRQPEMDQNTGSEYVRMMPTDGLDLTSGSSGLHFLGWHPTRDSLIVVMETLDAPWGNIVESKIFEWDLAADTVAIVARGAVNAQYSRDGRWLALTAPGEIAINADGTIQADAENTIELERPTLYIIDTTDGKVKATLPLIYLMNPMQTTIPIYEPLAAFSPDGRYLSAIVQRENFPASPQNSFSLTMIDLETMETIFNMPAFPDTPLRWSPRGDTLLYAPEQQKLAILDVQSGISTPLHFDDGMGIVRVDWSSTGEYISVQARPTEEFHRSSVSTLIYKID